MRKLVFLVAVILVVGVSARAQHPRVEIFGGYSYANLDEGLFPLSSLSGRRNANGWGASVSLNANRFFGFTADFAGQHGDVRTVDPSVGCILVFPPPPGCTVEVNFSTQQFLFGPRFTLRGGGATGFVHVLLGVTRTRLLSFTSLGGTVPARSETDFALAAGGGLDVRLSPFLALRAFQVDYIPVHQGGIINQNFAQNIRVQTGIVLRF
jgi:hypothetical protein